jgi:glutamine amidotransferase
MVQIIDYQSGNLGAIQNMFKKIGVETAIIADPLQLRAASKIILPGVGTFDTGMQNLISGGWLPNLGICLGMQLMTKGSEEGAIEGLGWVNGYTKRFAFKEDTYKIPHMGWNEVHVTKPTKLISKGTTLNRFYFAHGYYVQLDDRKEELLSTTYGFDFTSAIEKDNLLGVQFHPEKSHRFGMELLKNFIINY